MPFLDYFIRSTVLLTAAALVVLTMRRSSAARRHLVWFIALAAVLALPLVRRWTPRWDTPPVAIATLPNGPMRTVVEVTANSPAGSRLPAVLTSIWLAGAAIALFRFGRAHWSARRVVRESQAFDGAESGVRISEGVSVPMVCGFSQPVILLPPEARDWPARQLQSVLAHERMHVRRKDLWWQAVAQAACALYWPQPLIWLAASAMRKECEQACDDGVLVGGTPASDYAGHLVSIARALSVQERHQPQGSVGGVAVKETLNIGGIAMTRTSQLTSRISAVLDPSANRIAAGVRFGAGTAGLALAMLMTLAAIETPALAQPGRLAGVVRDPSGATVPRARVDVRSPDATFHEVAYTNDAGEYSLSEIPDGAYELTVAKEGFARLAVTGMKFESAAARPIDVTLQVGAIQERLEVTAERSSPVNPPVNGAAPKRIRVGGNVQPTKLQYRVPPLYPQTAKVDGVQGTVLLKAIIGLDGAILNLEPINHQVDKRLVESAMDAVKQWRYTPTLLNGQPVEVQTVVEVNFTLTK